MSTTMNDSEPIDSYVVKLLAQFHSIESQDKVNAIKILKTLDRQLVVNALLVLIYDQDADLRVDSAEALLQIDHKGMIELVLPLLADSNHVVRWAICGLLHDFGDMRAVPSLVQLLQQDPDASVRGIAAWALGSIGDSTAIPVLQQVVEKDTGVDNLGYHVRGAAVEAIRAIQARE